jgi:hypothetical protein
MIELKLNELYLLEGRVYRLIWTKWDNGKKQGQRALLKLLDNNEVNNLLYKELKGGLN